MELQLEVSKIKMGHKMVQEKNGQQNVKNNWIELFLE